jgi:hypothetical protein
MKSTSHRLQATVSKMKYLVNHKLLIILSLFILLLTTSKTVFSQNDKFSIRINLEITAEESIKSEVSSFLNKELRSLGDVNITDDSPHIKVRVIAVKNKFSSGLSFGYTLSVVVAQANGSLLESLLNRCPFDSQRAEEFWRDIILEQESHSQHILEVDNDLPSMCRKIIAQIDTNNIEPDRKIWQKHMNNLNRAKEKKKQ